MKLRMMLVWTLGCLLLVSCGGGGSSNNNGGGGQNSGLTIDSAPTAKLSGSQTNANTLSQEVQSDVPNLVESTSALNLPGAISTLPGGVTSTSINCSTLGTSGGSGTIDYSTDATSSTPAAGSVINISYNSCTIMSGTDTTTITGTVKVTIDSFVDYNNMSATITYSNFTISASGAYSFSYGPISGSYSYTVSNGTYTYNVNLSNGGVSNISASDVTINGNSVTITNATYVYNSSSAGGVVKVEFNNWSYDSTTGIPTSGTITVTGANGDNIVMTANGDNTVTVTYNINGSTSSYTVTFS